MIACLRRRQSRDFGFSCWFRPAACTVLPPLVADLHHKGIILWLQVFSKLDDLSACTQCINHHLAFNIIQFH